MSFIGAAMIISGAPSDFGVIFGSPSCYFTSIDGSASGTLPTESQGSRSCLNNRRAGARARHPTPIRPRFHVRSASRGRSRLVPPHQIDRVAFTYPAADVNPEICIEFRTDAEMDLFALNFTGCARLLDSPTLDFAVDFTV